MPEVYSNALEGSIGGGVCDPQRLKMTGVGMLQLLLLCALVALGRCGDYYVSPSGSNSGTGTSLASPFRTIGHAAAAAAGASGTSTIHVGAGDYDLSSSQGQVSIEGARNLDIAGPSTGQPARLLGGPAVAHRALSQSADADVWSKIRE